MYINLNKDKQLAITFDYSPETVVIVRSIPGRKYDPTKKHWLIPAENVVECLKKLRPLGFTAHIEVEHLARAREAELVRIEDIKAGRTELEKDLGLPLYNFQKIGANFMSNVPNALLADVPGLGKTIQTIASLRECPKILVLCPASLKFGWKDEIEKWGGTSVTVVNGNKLTREFQWSQKSRWVIANYELLLYDLPRILRHQWDAIVCDEATRISNPDAKSVKALKTIPSRKKIALTGTPVSNSPTDLFSIIDWLSPEYLGNFYQFKSKYCITESGTNYQTRARFHKVIGYRNMEELSDKISRFMLRRTKEEVLNDFPPKNVQDVVFALSEKEQEFYDKIRQGLVDELEKLKFSTSSLGMMLVKMLRLKQAANHPRLLTDEDIESSKLDTLRDLLKPIVESGDKAIIFTQFAEMAKILEKELAEYFPKMIYGDVKPEDRKVAVDEFNKNEENKVMIMTEAGAYGLNLQAASYVFNYDLPWSVAKLEQRIGRAHRIGQKKNVTVYNLLAKDTIDSYTKNVLHVKQKTSAKLLKDFERMEGAGLEIQDIKNILGI